MGGVCTEELYLVLPVKRRGREGVQVLVPSKFREALVLLAHEGPMVEHLKKSERQWSNCGNIFGGLVWLVVLLV